MQNAHCSTACSPTVTSCSVWRNRSCVRARLNSNTYLVMKPLPSTAQDSAGYCAHRRRSLLVGAASTSGRRHAGIESKGLALSTHTRPPKAYGIDAEFGIGVDEAMAGATQDREIGKASLDGA